MRNRLTGRLIIGLAALAAFVGTAQAATAPILVVEVDSGKVLYSQAPTDPWYPASVTKLMTAYVALDLVRRGQASLDTLLTISPAAAAEPPSKMGFKPGTQITLDNALKIIMVKSANDVAYAIGENLGGTLEGFADMMNETAHRIGMRESRWYNPHGLPDPRQWTSARDMATLGRAIMRDFPESRDLFSISAIQYGKAVMANHNGLLGRYAGADGMKTGFICSGGFNVVASATRNGRRIITVVMGQASARERDLKAADLFDYGFSQSAGWTAPTLEALSPSSVGGPPDLRPYVCDKRRPMPGDDGQVAGNPEAAGADAANAQLVGAASPASSALALATLNGASLRNRALPPRAPLQPILVWTGRDPAESAIALNEREEAQKTAKAAKAEAARLKHEAARQAKAEREAKARAAAVTQPRPAGAIAEAAKAKGKAGVPKATSAYTSVETTPVIAEERPSAAKVTRKPAAPAAKATVERKPTERTKPKLAESKPKAADTKPKPAEKKSAAAAGR